MRVQCDVCERAAASVMCCADEAVLCVDCDLRVHAANKLANKHHRVPLHARVGDSPRCDICQEKNGFFFCLEDRAVLCRDCDVSIHSVNKLAANHQRFLLPGTKVALEAICGDSGGGAPSPQEAAQPEAVMGRAGAAMSGTGTGTGGGKLPHQQQQQYQVTAARTGSPPVQATSTSPPTGGGGVVTAGRMALEIGRGPPSAARITATAAGGMVVSGPPPARVPAAAGAGGMVVPGPACSYVTNTSSSSHSSAGGSVGMGLGGLGGGAGVAGLRRSSISEYLTEGVPGWRVEELLNIPELAEGYTLADVCSSKADAPNLGDFDWTADLSLFDEQVYAESLHEVPQLYPCPSLSAISRPGRITSSVKGKGKQDMALVPDFDDSFVVPDIGRPSAPDSPPVVKRRRLHMV